MNKEMLIPILVNEEGEEKIVYKDVSSLSTESLIKLKTCYRGIFYDTSLAINEIIENNVLRNTQLRHMGADEDKTKQIRRIKRRKRHGKY